ncbi:MAG: hypothetical protein ACRDXD_13290 [Acidimicrobiia bacterium]
MNCSWCGREMGYVHGHGACLEGGCPMFGLNQAECCDGVTAASCGPTGVLRAAPETPSDDHS